MNFPTVKGSSAFRVIIFSPGSIKVKTAPYLCDCESCLSTYGFCPLFKEHIVEAFAKKHTSLRSSNTNVDHDPEVDEDDQDSALNSREILIVGSICTISAANSSSDTVWFIKINSRLMFWPCYSSKHTVD